MTNNTLTHKLPALPAAEENTYTPEAFRSLVERMRHILTQRRRKDMGSTRDFAITWAMRCAITPGNTTITVTSNLEGFDYEYGFRDYKTDYLCIRVCLYNTYIASVVATPTALRFYNDGWSSNTTNRRVWQCLRWFRALFGYSSVPRMDNRITVPTPVTRNQYEFLAGLSTPRMVVDHDGKKWYATDKNDHRDSCIELVLGRRDGVSAEYQDTPMTGAWATAARRLNYVDIGDSRCYWKPRGYEEVLESIRIDSSSIEDSRVLLLAASVPGITVEDSAIVIPRATWEDKAMWRAIPEEVIDCLPTYRVEKQCFGNPLWCARAERRDEPITPRMLINANKYCERSIITVEITAA